MGNASMHKWKMLLKYWGMVPTLSGPLGLGRAADTMVGGVYLTKRGRNVGTSIIYIGITTLSLGRPHYSSSPPSSTTSYSLCNPPPLLLHHHHAKGQPRTVARYAAAPTTMGAETTR